MQVHLLNVLFVRWFKSECLCFDKAGEMSFVVTDELIRGFEHAQLRENAFVVWTYHLAAVRPDVPAVPLLGILISVVTGVTNR